MAPCLARSAFPSQLVLQGRAISSLLTGVSQLRTWIMQMSADTAAVQGFDYMCVVVGVGFYSRRTL